MNALLLGTPNADGSITGVTTGTSAPIQIGDACYVTVYLLASALLSAGTLIIEEADYSAMKSFGGLTWSVVDTRTLPTDFAAAGGWKAVHLATGAYSALRARVGTTITGGTLVVSLKAV